VVSVTEFIVLHPYLFAGLPVLALLLVLSSFARDRDYRWTAMFSGFACVPCSVLAATHGDYWNPVRLGGFAYGVEDLIFTYTAGTAAWMAAALWVRNGWTVERSRTSAVRRMMPWGLCAVIDVALWQAGLDSMTAALAASLVLLACLVVRRPALWRLAVAGMVTFSAFYVAVLRLQFAAWPAFVRYWNPGGWWIRSLFGIPVGDVAWAAVFGAVWPLVIANALDIRFEGQPDGSREHDAQRSLRGLRAGTRGEAITGSKK
jgi:hypothetical protein